MTKRPALPCPIQTSRSSRRTSINKAKVPRIGRAAAKQNLWQAGTTNLDIGGGRYDSLTVYLRDHHDVVNLIYDPFNRTEDHNARVLEHITCKKPDTITLSNVLNVIDDRAVVMDLIGWSHSLLSDSGLLLITTYEGNRTGQPALIGGDQFQANQPTSHYVPLVQQVFTKVSVKDKLIVATKITV